MSLVWSVSTPWLRGWKMASWAQPISTSRLGRNACNPTTPSPLSCGRTPRDPVARRRLIGGQAVSIQSGASPGVSAIAVIFLVAALVLVGGCARGTGTGSASVPEGTEISAMFLRNREKLRPARETIQANLSVDLAGVVTPLPGNPSKDVTLDFILKSKEGAPTLVVAALVPYEVGNVASGPGARFFSFASDPVLLAPGENKQVSVKAVRERVGQAQQGGQPASPAGPIVTLTPPLVTPAPEADMRGLGSAAQGQHQGGGVAFGQLQVGYVWGVRAGLGEGRAGHLLGSLVGGRDGSPDGAMAQAGEASPPSLFDPSLGLKVLVVVGLENEVGSATRDGVRLVTDAEFEGVYGKFERLDLAIPVPPQQLI